MRVSRTVMPASLEEGPRCPRPRPERARSGPAAGPATSLRGVKRQSGTSRGPRTRGGTLQRGHRRLARVECFEVTGGTALRGRVRVTGAKNSALKLMAAPLLAAGRTVIDEVPDILDVTIMSEVLRRLGCGVAY